MDPYVEFDSFFHQLLPMTDQDHRLMYGLPDDITKTFQGGLPPINSNSTQVFMPNIPSPDEARKGNKRPLDQSSEEDNDKQKARRANQNLACRNYRRRKKEYVQELESKVATLEMENETLKKENNAYKRGEIDAMEPAMMSMLVELKQVLEKIREAVKNNADDRTLTYLLQLFFLTVEKKYTMGEKEIEKLVNPLTQAKLATMGYVPIMEHPTVYEFSGPGGNDFWIAFQSEAQITEEQAKNIKDLRDRHWKLDNELRLERRALDKVVKDFYLNKLRVLPTFDKLPPSENPQVNSMDMGEVIEFARQLNFLKKNFIAQRSLMLDVHSHLSKILTPRQLCMMLIRINAKRTLDWPRHAQTLRSAWQLFSEEKPTQNGTTTSTYNSLL